jgi:hypothetical protein
MSFTFDTLAYVRQLRDVKIAPEQTEGGRTECGPALADVAAEADILRIEAKIDAMEKPLAAQAWRFHRRRRGFDPDDCLVFIVALKSAATAIDNRNEMIDLQKEDQ